MSALFREISNEGMFSLYSRTGEQWANGTFGDKRNESEFLPLWNTIEAAVAWLPHWPSYEVRIMNRDELRSEILMQINNLHMWIGLGVDRSLIAMCHPIWVKDMLETSR